MKNLKTIIVAVFLFAAVPYCKASVQNDTLYIKDIPAANVIFSGDSVIIKTSGMDDVKLAVHPKPDAELKQKIISAMLAFPFPFGFMGAHRVMLGCKPWIPVVYVATFGGCFGLLPLIDFCVIVFSKDIKQYENNPHIFMWLK
jgi:TM2 domain-containing membrane protein YozV